jgi:hypothetical protein
MTNIFVSGDRLIGDVKFADAETYGFADQIFRLIKKGYITAGSVGFIPLDFTFSEDRRSGIDFHRQELLEFSVVPVPANSNALVVQAVKSLVARGSAPAAQSQTRLSTMSFSGTGAQRAAQLAAATRADRHERAHHLLNLELAFSDDGTVAGRRKIARAFKRHAELTRQ